jgi:hypothetical protein
MIAQLKSIPTSKDERDELNHRLTELDDLLTSIPPSAEAARQLAPLWQEWTVLRLEVRGYDLAHGSHGRRLSPHPARPIVQLDRQPVNDVVRFFD